MEEILKELKALKEDRKHDWEIITFLRERLQNSEKLEKQKNQDELERKIDILTESFVESQKVMKAEMENLSGKVDKVVDDVLKSKEMKTLIDGVEVTDGYLDIFGKDFKEILTGMEALHVKMGRLEGKIQEFGQLNHQMETIASKVDRLSVSVNTMQNKALNENKELNFSNLTKEVNDLRQRIETNVESQKLEFKDFKAALEEKLENFSINTVEPTEIAYSCWNANCRTVFPKNIKFREDGVSFVCTNAECRVFNIVGKLENGRKWMRTKCNDVHHYQQFPVDIKHGQKKTCQICGKEKTVSDTILSAIDSRANGKIPYQNTVNGTTVSEEGKKLVETAKENRNQCYNLNCNTTFPRNLELKEDGVSVRCPNQKCRNLNIVGKLKENHRWMVMFCNNKFHHQQFPLHQKHYGMAKCQVCGIEGKTYGQSCHAAIPI